ncbi:MAG: hypothetical protein PUB42_01120 [Firmicutes bacterium]|nr:hypothetical protein [Bacillota bacterium]
MKYIKKILIFLIVSIMTTIVVPLESYAANEWEGWSLPAEAKKNDNGTISLSNSTSAGINMIKRQSFASEFDIEFTMKVDSFAKETGIQVITGKYRLFMNLSPNQIIYFTGDGSTNTKAVLSYNIGTDMHNYLISVSGAKAGLYIDDNYVGNMIIQTKNDSNPRMLYWVTGNSEAKAAITVSDIKYTSMAASTSSSLYDPRVEVNVDMSTLDVFDIVEKGGTVLSDEGYAHMEA